MDAILPREAPRRQSEATQRRARVRRLLVQQPLAIMGGVVLLLFVVISALPGLFATHSPFDVAVDEAMQPPSRRHWFGTDELGRDVYSRVIHGTRLSLGSGIGVVLTALVIGTALGLIAGYRGGRVDLVSMRIADVFIAFPNIIVAMAIVAFVGRNLQNAMFALAVSWWPQFARLARGQTIALLHQPYVEAARAVGASDRHILVRHILPNIFAPILVKGTLDVGFAILLTASLSFLGLGAQPPSPELGAMVTVGREYILTAWWYATLPGFVIFALVLSFNVVGDGVRDLMDPVLRGRM